MPKQILLISSKEEDNKFVSLIAGNVGYEFKCVNSAEEGAEIIATEDISVIFVEVSSREQYEKFESAIRDKVGIFSEKLNANAIHFLSSTDLHKSDYLIGSTIFGNFIYKNFKDPQTAAELYSNVVRALSKDRSFGLANFLKPNSKVQVIKLKTSASKLSTVDAVKSYLMAAKFQARMAALVANAVDELLMNAMFDAPVDQLSKPLYTSIPRSTVLTLENQSAVEMHIGFDGEYVGIAVIDYFGSLDKTRLFSHIAKAYGKQEYRVKSSVAGAGIGLATIFRTGGSFIFLSESRAKTEVIVFFRKTDNFREFKRQFRFVTTQFYF